MATATELARDGAAPAAPSRRLRVAQVVTKLTAGAGGITLRGALGLDPERYVSTIVTADGGSLIAAAEAAHLEVVRLRHMAPDISPLDDLRGVREITAVLARGDFDLVHTHSAKAGAVGRLAARRAGVPAVVHSFHGFPFHEFQPRARRRAYLALERRLAAITDYFMTDGTFVAAEAVRLGLAAPERIRAIASPIDTMPVASPLLRARARHLLGIPLDAKVIGTAARLDAQKSPLDMVSAIARMRRSDVYAVWLGDGELRAACERLIAREGLRDRFLLPGARRDVPALLPAFDVFALPSIYEGLPCSVVEAMACGIPVVATAVNSVPEIVVAGRTGLVTRPGDPEALGRALEYLLDNPAEARRMAAAAREHIGGRFRPEVLGRDLDEAYTSAIAIASRRQ